DTRAAGPRTLINVGTGHSRERHPRGSTHPVCPPLRYTDVAFLRKVMARHPASRSGPLKAEEGGCVNPPGHVRASRGRLVSAAEPDREETSPKGTHGGRSEQLNTERNIYDDAVDGEAVGDDLPGQRKPRIAGLCRRLRAGSKYAVAPGDGWKSGAVCQGPGC